MNYNVGMIARTIFLLLGIGAQAQIQFNFNGVGRALVTSNSISGEVTKNDTLSWKRGIGGYALFDLKPNLIINNNVKANVILRVRNPFGSFFGANTAFTFRQLQISGRIGKLAEYELGDIYLGSDMSAYTVFNPDDYYREFESEIFSNRRAIVEYENFIEGNQWRLQGVKAKTQLNVNRIIKNMYASAFFSRINPTNDKNIADQILAGSRLRVVQSDYLTAGATYTGLLDIPVVSSLVEYQNNVLTGDVSASLKKSAFSLKAKLEGGISQFSNKRVLDDTTVSYSDYFYDGMLKAGITKLRVHVGLGIRNVGPQYTSAAAQTLRLNTSRYAELFPVVSNNTLMRGVNAFDRMTDEYLYNRSINPVMGMFLPDYGNVMPYGQATPNRKGYTISIASDTSLNVLNLNARADILTEVKGEGTEDLRSFTSIQGGLLFKLGSLLSWSKRVNLSGGIRLESTQRSGDAPVDFSSSLLDGGASVEIFKKFDLLFGYKSLQAQGNEFLAVRSDFNTIASFLPYSSQAQESTVSGGMGIRFGEKSYFSLQYNSVNYSNGRVANFEYKLNQLFCNYSLVF
ncbi:MAG: hypothetical protein MUF42_02380 [Cytophagaceae bacterium]|jgi:hypothetical protein|nr:hypothetical protein [Cytophagaceae bacterium]